MQSRPFLRSSSLLIVFSLIFVALLPACIIVVDEDDDYDDHYRRRWSLDVIVYGSISESPVDNKTYSLDLNDDALLSGRADCAGFEGAYTVNDNNTISIERLSRGSSTCGSSSIAGKYLDGLEEARSYSVSEDALIIQFGESGNSMRFSPVE